MGIHSLVRKQNDKKKPILYYHGSAQRAKRYLTAGKDGHQLAFQAVVVRCNATSPPETVLK